ncbi:MAG: MBOAT family protein [Clostridiales bacterium]|nr:MBOAT family protein [Clostridiales bacterium]
MLFNSYIFIFIFLPLVLVGWYGFNHYKKYRLANFFLAGMSLWFYGYFNINYLAVILVSIGMNYLLSYLLTKIPEGSSHRTAWNRVGLFTGLALNLGILFYFKYYDFFIENINVLFGTDFTLRNILLPLGISFFTFQQLSFIIDRCQGRAGHYPFLDYVTFVTFFPQLIAGPIVLYDEIIPQFQDISRRRPDSASFSRGIYLFVLGLAKKVLLADTFALMANYGFAQTFSLDGISTVAVILSYSFELYFDFSGYSDMAIGLGKMFNVDLPLNFNSPYRACSIKEFWQRWHITLSRFFITYVYIPLGGSRKGKTRMLINTFLIFLLSGLWHGAAWTYVIWGVIHGILVVWDNLGIIGIRGREEKRPSKYHIPAWLGWICTFSVFNLSLFFFRSESITGAVQLFKNLVSGAWNGKLYDIAAQLDISEIYMIRQFLDMAAPDFAAYVYLIFMIFLFLLAFFLIFRPNAYERTMNGNMTSAKCWAASILLVWCILSLSQVSTFLYFNF